MYTALTNLKTIIAGSVQKKKVWGPLFKMIKNFKMATAESKPGMGPLSAGPACDCTGHTPRKLTLDGCLPD